MTDRDLRTLLLAAGWTVPLAKIADWTVVNRIDVQRWTLAQREYPNLSLPCPSCVSRDATPTRRSIREGV